MALRVLTPAPVTDLVELASLKSRLGITSSDEDAVLAEYIDEAGSLFRESEVLGREILRQEYEEIFHPDAVRRELRLSCNPVDPESVSVEIDGEAITDFEVRDADAGIIYRQIGWPASNASDEGDGIAVTYKGGFLIPASATAKGVVTTWAAATAYLAGSWVRSTSPTSALRFECTTAGTSHATTEPTWPTTAGSTVTDGTAIWTARTAQELPLVIRQLAGISVKDLRHSAVRPAGLTSSAGEGFSRTWSAGAITSTGIAPEILERLGPLRARYGRC